MTDEIKMGDEQIVLQSDNEGLTLDDFGTSSFVKDPAIGETLTMTVLRIDENPNTTATVKETGKEFIVGVKYKDGRVKRIDIETDQGVYTIKSWEIFFKLLSNKSGQEGALIKYAKSHNGMFSGAKISIKRLAMGVHANYKIDDLAKIIGKSVEETKVYQLEIKAAIKESRLFEVKLLN